MERLAKSDLVRQSFIRHVFRYWMGRNEMMSDSKTLIAMDKAYVESKASAPFVSGLENKHLVRHYYLIIFLSTVYFDPIPAD